MTDKETPEPLGAPESPTAPSAPTTPDSQPGWEDRDGNGILQGDEIDITDPFDAIDGDE
jgi:hypothetical protein